jgi:spore coat polysaccharide biosynthesis protein SpsF
MECKVVLITQARIGSTRLPSKVIKEILGRTLIEIQLLRVKGCLSIHEIVVATPPGDDQKPIHDVCNRIGVKYFEGSETNVLERFYLAGLFHNADYVVRITSDCPLIDPMLIDHVVGEVIEADKDYGSNTLKETFPDGQDIEVFKLSALADSRKRVKLNSDKEHVTPFLKRNCETNQGQLYSSISILNDCDYSSVRMTVDEVEDFHAIDLLVKELGFNSSWSEYANYIQSNTHKFTNQKILRNEGYFSSLKKD